MTSVNLSPIKLEHEQFGLGFSQATVMSCATNYRSLSKRLRLPSLKIPKVLHNSPAFLNSENLLLYQQHLFYSSNNCSATRNNTMADEEHARKYGKYIKGQGEDDKRGIGHKDPPSYTEDIRDDAVGSELESFYLKKQTNSLCASSRRKCRRRCANLHQRWSQVWIRPGKD